MGKKASKATKKFAASGQLKKTIQARHKAQQIKKKIQGRRGNKGGKGIERSGVEGGGDEEDDEAPTATNRYVLLEPVELEPNITWNPLF